MKIIVEFENEAEFKARIKNPRGGKDDDGSAPQGAPAPIMPPQQPAFNPAPPPAAFTPPQGGFPGQPPVGDPVVAGLVQRIVTRIDSAIASGQPSDAVLNWFRTQAGPGAELRTYVIALGLSPQVVDCVDKLSGVDEIEDRHAAEISEAEDEAEERGRESMKEEILADVNRWLEKQPNYDLIAAPCKALIKEIEKVKV